MYVPELDADDFMTLMRLIEDEQEKILNDKRDTIETRILEMDRLSRMKSELYQLENSLLG